MHTSLNSLYDSSLIKDPRGIKQVFHDTFSGYFEAKDRSDVHNFMIKQCQQNHPEMSYEQARDYYYKMRGNADEYLEKKESLQKAKEQGRSLESWFKKEIDAKVQQHNVDQYATYHNNINESIDKANLEMDRTIHTQDGQINQNPNLDGYIAEQDHVNTFNIDSATRKSDYEAQVLRPDPGKPYEKNSPDIVVKNTKTNEEVQKIQSKYHKDPKSTETAIKDGDYEDQIKLVPEGQSKDIDTPTVEKIETKDGTSSNTLSKDEAKRKQEKAQTEGNAGEYSWNDVKFSSFAKTLAIDSVKAGVLSAGIDLTTNTATKLFKGEKIDHKELLIDSAKTGAKTASIYALAGSISFLLERFGVSVAKELSSDLICTANIALEKSIKLNLIRKIDNLSIDSGTIFKLATWIVESAKASYDFATGKQNIDKTIEQYTDMACVALVTIPSGMSGSYLGGVIGSLFGPIGTGIGAACGGLIAELAGANFAQETLNEVKQKAEAEANKARHTLKDKAINNMMKLLNKTWNATKQGSIFVYEKSKDAIVYYVPKALEKLKRN